MAKMHRGLQTLLHVLGRALHLRGFQLMIDGFMNGIINE